MDEGVLENLAMRAIENNLFIHYHSGPHAGAIIVTHSYYDHELLYEFESELGGRVTNRSDGIAWLARDNEAVAILEELLPVMEGIWRDMEPGEDKKHMLIKIIYCKQTLLRAKYENHPD